MQFAIPPEGTCGHLSSKFHLLCNQFFYISFNAQFNTAVIHLGHSTVTVYLDYFSSEEEKANVQQSLANLKQTAGKRTI